MEIPRLSCRVIEAKWISGDVVQGMQMKCEAMRGNRFEADTLRLNTLDTGLVKCEQLVAEATGGQPVA